LSINFYRLSCSSVERRDELLDERPKKKARDFTASPKFSDGTGQRAGSCGMSRSVIARTAHSLFEGRAKASAEKT
jgi:hypothetical protein